MMWWRGVVAGRIMEVKDALGLGITPVLDVCGVFICVSAVSWKKAWSAWKL